MTKRLVPKEPLVLFLFFAALIFGYDFLLSDQSELDNQLTVSQGNIRHLSAGFEKTWQRPPTAEELQHLIEERVREEVYYREALALGLDDEDTIVKRRLRQKYEFLVEDLGGDQEPGDEELAAYLQEHSRLFKLDAQLAFKQIFLDPSKSRNTTAYIDSIKSRLNNNTLSRSEILELSDSFMLAFSHPFSAARVIDSNFGTGFTDKLLELPTGSWQGPIKSGYGYHLVHVEQSIAAREPALDEVRPRVLVEWQRDQKQAFLQKHYQSLLLKYEVVIETAQADSGAEA